MISRTDRGGTLQSDLAAVTSKTSAKMRLGLGQQNRFLTSGLGKNERTEEEERGGGDLRSRMREKRSYAARVLGDLVGGETRKRKSDPQEDEEGEKRLVRKKKTDTSRDEDRKRRSDPKDEDEEVERLMRKRRSDLKDNEEKVKRLRETSPGKMKKKKSKDKKEKKEKKSKKSKRSHSPNEDQGSDRNALQMAQEFSKEYEPIRSRKMKVKKTEHDDDDLGLGLSLDTSLETSRDHGHKLSETSGDVMKDLDDFLND